MAKLPALKTRIELLDVRLTWVQKQVPGRKLPEGKIHVMVKPEHSQGASSTQLKTWCDRLMLVDTTSLVKRTYNQPDICVKCLLLLRKSSEHTRLPPKIKVIEPAVERVTLNFDLPEESAPLPN